MHVLGDMRWFLGIWVVRDRSAKKLWLYQDSYIEKIAASYHLVVLGKYPDTPMTTERVDAYAGTASKQDVYLYQRRVGSLNYAATITRPDIA
jgi:hypothetical protein